jgi:uncharacterized protein YprB with RNaseH-like and TPR domain
MNLDELRTRLGPPHLLEDLPDESGGVARLPEQLVLRDGPDGQIALVDTLHPLDHRHGKYSMGFIRDSHTGHLMRLSSGGAVDLKSMAFVDTETTGLGYGVGTLVFLIGIGHLTDQGLHVRQFFLRHPGEEARVLRAVSDYLDPFTCVVTFNGKSFDWPVMENRFVLSRLRMPDQLSQHVDLLHISRRLWKLRLQACGLSGVEKTILAVRRSGSDVPGWMIPQLYFRYLRSGDGSQMQSVLYHNRLDVLSLAALMSHIDRVLARPLDGIVEHALDYYSLGRLHQETGEYATARGCLTRAREMGLPEQIDSMSLLRLAMIEKKQRNWKEFNDLMSELLRKPCYAAIAAVELAKYKEHVAGDYSEASRLTVRAMQTSDRSFVGSWPGIGRSELYHRYRRLARRMSPVDPSVIAPAS